MKSFSTEEVNRVIQRALLLKQRIGISREDLLEIGRELGLKSEVIEAALLQEMAEKSKETAERDWRQSRKFGFHWHLWSYLITCGILLLINSLTPGPWWFQWPVIGWGIGLLFHFQSVYFPTTRQVEKGLAKTCASRHSVALPVGPNAYLFFVPKLYSLKISIRMN